MRRIIDALPGGPGVVGAVRAPDIGHGAGEVHGRVALPRRWHPESHRARSVHLRHLRERRCRVLRVEQAGARGDPNIPLDSEHGARSSGRGRGGVREVGTGRRSHVHPIAVACVELGGIDTVAANPHAQRQAPRIRSTCALSASTRAWAPCAAHRNVLPSAEIAIEPGP